MFSVLVPLCGKTKDLLWLSGQGCDVVGVEFCAQAVAEFFTEHAIPHEKTDAAYVATDRKLKVYYGDFFTCPIAEKVSLYYRYVNYNFKYSLILSTIAHQSSPSYQPNVTPMSTVSNHC